ncbi:MAG: hypothetical protein Q8P13_05380 [bacterium]|nr:hypothetical protein [bacterium]
MKINIAGTQILDLLRNAQKALVILSDQPSTDSVAAALSWAEIGGQIGKNVEVVCFGTLPDAAKNLEKVATIKSHLDPINLVVSFNWSQNMIEKVSYSVEGEKFNLIITPSGKKLDPTAVEYSHRGVDYDLIISLGISNPSELSAEKIDRNIFQSIPTINIDNQASNASYGKVNVVDGQEDSISGLVSTVFEQTHIAANSKVAELLLFGMRSATKNFEEVKNPLTFEHAAYCTKIKNFPGTVSTGLTEAEKGVDWFSPEVMRSSKTS